MSDATAALKTSTWSSGQALKLALALVLALGLAAFVLRTSFAHYLAREKPGLTLRFAPENAAAKIEKAERIITRALGRAGALTAAGEGEAAGGLLGVGRNLTAAVGVDASPPAQASPPPARPPTARARCRTARLPTLPSWPRPRWRTNL